MGNNASKGEATAGGFLTIFGTILAFTPAGPFTSSWMIPLGGSLMTGKEQPIGGGITYGDDGGGIKPYIGTPERALINREIEYEREKRSWKSYKEYSDIASQINMKNYINSLKEHLYDTFKPDYKKDDKINMFRFVSHKETKPEFIKKIEEMTNINEFFRTYKYNLDKESLVDRIYVIRRKLDILPVYFGWAAHSGLLMKTKGGKYYICEYGVEKDPNKVSLYEIKGITEKHSDTFEIMDGRKWNKQICGSSPTSEISIYNVKETMENKVNKHNYWLLFWNCHMAQEMTRKELGLKVDNPYLNRKYVDEMDFMLSAY